MGEIPERWQRLGEVELELTYRRIEVWDEDDDMVEADYEALARTVLAPVLADLRHRILDEKIDPERGVVTGEHDAALEWVLDLLDTGGSDA